MRSIAEIQTELRSVTAKRDQQKTHVENLEAAAFAAGRAQNPQQLISAKKALRFYNRMTTHLNMELGSANRERRAQDHHVFEQAFMATAKAILPDTVYHSIFTQALEKAQQNKGAGSA